MYPSLQNLQPYLNRCDRYLRQHLMAQSAPPNSVRVVIQHAPQAGTTLRQEVQRVGGFLRRELSLIDGLAVELPGDQLHVLAAHPDVRRLSLDRPVHMLLDVASPTLGAPQLWNKGETGEGAVVAIIDTGVYPHPDLMTPTNRIAGFIDLVQGKTDPYDDNGHGTHVAGCALGNGASSNGQYRGPAPNAKLVAVKALDAQGSGELSAIIAGVQWCVQQKQAFGIGVLSLSLGGPAQESYRDDPLCQALEKAWQAGIVVCVAAGNEGPGSKTISSPGIDPLIITVGAENDQRTPNPADDVIANFSSRGPTLDGLTKPDLVTPGVNIISLRAPGSVLDRQMPDARVGTQYFQLSGTSMATPLCAGVAAVLLAQHPQTTPDALKRALMNSANDLFHAPLVAGKGLVDAPAAQEALMAAPSPAPTPPISEAPLRFGRPATLAVLNALQQATKRIRLAVPTVTVASVLQALRTASSRGVQVDLLLDAGGSDVSGVAHYLAGYGVTVRQKAGLSQALLLIDNQAVLQAGVPWNYTTFLGDSFPATVHSDAASITAAESAWEVLWATAPS
ncbi:MAG: S8 family serine peptidase [Firmicutes bacterium]|nr:S8 family serine peptidase [Bacillota bacterium]